MKTITEFSGVLLQRAAEVQRAFRAANPQVAEPAAQDTPSVTEAAAPAAGDDAVAATGEPQAEAAPAADSAEETAAGEAAPSENQDATEPPATDAPPSDLGSGPEAEAVGAALDVQGDRLSRLMEALDVAGRRAGQVRLVRVLQGETPPQGAQKRGDFFYAVDLLPRPQSQQRDGFDSRDGDRRRGPGGRDRGGRPGDRGPGGARGSGGPPGKGGKFSNDRPSRDGDLREGRGEMPRGGAGWTLTRAPDDRRGRSDEPGAQRRDRRPPPRPRFDPRGPRPGMGAAGDRPPRGPRPDRAPGRPPFAGPRSEATGGDRPPTSVRPEGRPARPAGPDNGRRGPGPRPADGPRRDDRNWSGRRRGGWDEPTVPEAPAVAAPPAPEPAAEPTTTIERPPAPAAESPAPASAENGANPSSADQGS